MVLYREVIGVAVDSPGTRHFDDAFSICQQREDGSWRIQLHIADVAWSVVKGMEHDRLARLRGFTTYKGDGVVTMLSPLVAKQTALSRQTSRRAFMLSFLIKPNGDVEKVRVEESRCRLSARLSSSDVNQMLEDESNDFTYRWWNNALALAKRLYESRTRAAHTGEEETAGLVLDLDDVVDKSSAASFIVSEIMVLGNFVLTRLLTEAGYTMIYRAYREKINPPDHRQLLSQLGVSPTPQMLRGLYCTLRDVPNRARYVVDPDPHEGLGFPYYGMFTSGLRSYADLVNQRILRAFLYRHKCPYTRDELIDIVTHLNALFESKLDKSYKYFVEECVKGVDRSLARKMFYQKDNVFSLFVRDLLAGVIPLSDEVVGLLQARFRKHANRSRQLYPFSLYLTQNDEWDPNGASPYTDPAETLDEWTGRWGLPWPKYSFDRLESGVIICFCEVLDACWRGLGHTKDEAGTSAAYAACEHIFGLPEFVSKPTEPGELCPTG